EKLVAGGLWAKGSEKSRSRDAGPVPISMAESLAHELGLAMGDEVVWDVQGVRIPSRITSLRDVSWARFEPNFFVVFPEGPLDEAPQMFVTLVRVDDPAARGALQRRLAEAGPHGTAVGLAQAPEAVEANLGR